MSLTLNVDVVAIKVWSLEVENLRGEEETEGEIEVFNSRRLCALARLILRRAVHHLSIVVASSDESEREGR